MGLLGELGAAMFGRSKTPDLAQRSNDEHINETPASGKGASLFDYHYNPQRLPNAPGPAYISPLLQFQEYPRQALEGWGGIAYKESFKSFEPKNTPQQFTSVPSGTSGIVHGQLFSQPLVDTSPSQ